MLKMTQDHNTTFKVMNQEFVKLNWFDGTNFNRWKDKMMFSVLDPNTTSFPNVAKDASKEEKEKIAQLKKKCDKDIFACQGHIVNTLH